MILTNDTIKEVINNDHYRTKYRCYCDKCGKDRGYLTKQNGSRPFCRSCSPRHTEESKKKRSAAMMGNIPWNKGREENRHEVIDKLANSHKGRVAHNRGTPMTFEQKVKLSCASQRIDLSEFDGLKTSEAKLERNKFADLKLHIGCFQRDNYTCRCCCLTNTILNAHHMNSWKFFPEQRFDLNNLISLCETCHSDFHRVYGNGKSAPNTVEQINEFKKTRTNHNIRKIVFVVAGVSGAGKSWICNQLSNKFLYIGADKIDKSSVRSIIYNTSEPHILYDPTVHVTSFIRRNLDVFDIRLLVIIENEQTILTRLIGRGGNFTDGIKRRMKRMLKIKGAAEFSGTSIEILEYLNNLSYDKS